jgi:hypothetical protein
VSTSSSTDDETTSTSTSASATGSASVTSEATTDICYTPEEFECDQWIQDCCEDEKCLPIADGANQWTSTMCVPLSPVAGKIGEPCHVAKGEDSCEKYAMCWSWEGPGAVTGTCIPLCQGDLYTCLDNPGGCCPDDFECAIAAIGVLNLCIQICDPVAQDCIGEANGCYPSGESFACRDDSSGGTGAPGAPCEYINACDPGNFCGSPEAFPGCDLESGGCCIPFCKVDVPICDPGTKCVHWYDPQVAPVGYENLGFCTIEP